MANLNIPSKNTGDTLSASEFNQVVSAVNSKVDVVSGKGLSTNDYTAADKATLSGMSDRVTSLENRIDVLSGNVISLEEHEAGVLRYGGKEYTVYELTAELGGLPATSGGTAIVVLSPFPCGDGLYLSIPNLSVSSGDSFLPSAYAVKRIYVNEYLDTVAEIVCKESVTGIPKVLLTVQYVKGLLSYDAFELSIPLSDLGITSAAEISVGMPALKYNKKFALSWTTDDSILGIYSLIFKYINKKYIDDTYNYHDGMPPTTGFTPTRVLCSTDGCGHDIRFRVDSGWVSYSSSMKDEIHSDSFPYQYVRWSEMVTFLDFFNTAMNHGGGNQDKPLESIEMCGDRLAEKTGYFPYLLLVPGGTTGYPETSETLDYIYHYHNKLNLNYSTDNLTKADFVVKTGLLGRKTYDGMTYEQLCGYVDAEAVRNDHPYIYMGGHVVADSSEQIKWTDAVKPFLDYLYDTYGKGGNDTIWMAGPEEVYEYLFTRAFSVVTSSVADGNLIIKAKIARMPLFKRFEFSLLLKKVSGNLSSTPAISVNKDVMKLASGLKNGELLINVNYNSHLLELAEKYTSKYEQTSSDIDKEDAMCFVSMLNSDLQTPFLARLTANENPPVLNTVSINSGAATTYDREVSIVLGVTGGITHYKVSEDAGMAGTSWIAGTSKILSYILSAGYGSKTVYVQVKNTYGESAIKSSLINYAEQPSASFTVTGTSNNSEYGTVTPASQVVAQGGTANLSAQANDGFEIGSWSFATSSTGVGTASGTATVTNVQSDKSVICNFKSIGGGGAGGGIILLPADTPSLVTLPNGLKASKVRARFSTAQKDSPVYNTLGETAGNKVVSADSLPAGVADFDTSSSTNPVLSGDSGVYPDAYINVMYGVYNAGVYPSTRGLVRLTGIKSGTYKVKVLYSTQKTLTSAQISGITYEANGVVANPPSGFNPTNNNSTFIEMDNVTVGSGGILDIYMGNTQGWVRTGWNAIEIEEIG